MSTQRTASLGLVPLCSSFALATRADTSDVKGPPPVVAPKAGDHCVDDPNCFNRYHPDIKPVARARAGERAYVVSSVAVDLRIAQLVGVPNYTVSAILPLDIFEE